MILLRKRLWIYHYNLMSKWWSETKTIAFCLIRTKPLSADASALPENNREIRWVSPWHFCLVPRTSQKKSEMKRKKFKSFSFWNQHSGTEPATGMPSGSFKSGKVSETQMFILNDMLCLFHKTLTMNVNFSTVVFFNLICRQVPQVENPSKSKNLAIHYIT